MIIRQLLLLFFISIFSTASGTITLSQDEQAYLKEKKEIKVCISPKGLPLFDYKEGQNIGILPEIMFLLEKKIPIPVHYIPIKTWEECIRLTKEKKADISTMILASPNRHTHLIPTHKVIEGSIGIATKINEQLHNDLAEISFKKVALLNGQTSISQYVKHNFPNLTIVMVDSIEEGLKMVIKGKVYGYVDETFSLAYHILRLHSNELKIIDRMNKTPLHGSLGIRKDEPQLLNIMNKAIDSTDEQEIRDIVHHWISVRVEKKIDYTLLVAIVSVFLLILLVSLYLIKLKQTEQQNLYLAERIKLAFDGSRDGLWDWNLLDNSVYFSPRWKEMLGYKDDELENSFDTWQSRVHPDDLGEVLKDIELCRNDKEKIYENKHRLRHKDGHWVWIYDRGKVQRDIDGKAIRMIGTHTDLTTEINLNNELSELNQTLKSRVKEEVEKNSKHEHMIMQKNRLAEMGEMLSSIAHQWRRPLSILHINIEMLEEDYKEGKIDKKFLDNYIEKNSSIIQYMSKTIDDFQNFYKINKEKRLFDVMEKIKSVSDLKLNQLEKNGIQLTKEGESFTVLGYPSEFQQVILNLLSNAKDALLEKEIKNPYIKIVVSSDRDKGYIRVSDNAGGIDEKTMDKIFEPYFTTKEENGGTGLGLYISKMIIEKNMHGELTISNQGEGCEVLITLLFYDQRRKRRYGSGTLYLQNDH
jgi:PAS domain S-box-containing protein